MPIIGTGAQTLNGKTINHTWAPPATGERSSDLHKKRSCIQNQIQNKISSHNPHSQKTPILSSSRQGIFQGKCIRTKQEGSQSHQARAISISWLPSIMTQHTIHAEPLKTRSGLDLTAAYQKLHSLLTNIGLRPHLHILDNYCLNVLEIFMREVNKIIQLVLPHIHQRNSAERAIRTFKERFIAGLSSTHKDFPLHLLCQLIPHAILTLNLLRPLCMNPKLSGYAKLHGEFNYNATPLAPPGTQVTIHENPTVRGTWSHPMD